MEFAGTKLDGKNVARARNIKPSFFINEELVELPFSTRLLFIGLWTIADREGRLEDKPKKIKMALFPADDFDVNEALNQLQNSGFIVRYIADEIQYIQILAFGKHQNPHIKEPASTIPAPCKHDAKQVPAVLIPDSPLLIPDSLSPSKPTRTSALDDGFDEFWNAYPKKNSKGRAEQAWKKHKPNIDLVMKALAWQIESDKWQEKDGKFIPYPASYINAQAWLDEPQKERMPF